MKKYMWVVVVAFFGGCVPSLHQLYTDKDVVYDANLVGVWGDVNKPDREMWTFSKGSEPNSYDMIYTDKDGKKGPFKVRLMKLNSLRFLDIFPDDPNTPYNDYYKMHLIPTHSFMRVDEIGAVLKLAAMDKDKFEGKLKSDPGIIKHEIVEKTAVITADTGELQKFMLKYAKAEWVFGEVQKMARIKTIQTSDPNVSRR